MAEPAAIKKQEQTDAAVAPPDIVEPPKRPSALFGLLKAIAFVSVLVIVEVVAGAMFIPSVKDTEKLAKQYAAAAAGHTATSGESEGNEGGHSAEAEEIELGTYNITHFNPATSTTLSIDFELFGTVLASDKAEFEKLFEKNKIRAREQVIMTLHAAEAKDLSDTGLGLLKRQILEKTNRALGQPILKEVLFSKFNFVER